MSRVFYSGSFGACVGYYINSTGKYIVGYVERREKANLVFSFKGQNAAFHRETYDVGCVTRTCR